MIAQGIIGDPRLLILDEPSGGCAPIVVDRILDVVTSLGDERVAVVLVEQLVEKALRRVLVRHGAPRGQRHARGGKANRLATSHLSRPSLRRASQMQDAVRMSGTSAERQPPS